MHLKHVFRTTPLMMIIVVLRYNQQLPVMHGLEFREGEVSSIGLRIPTVRPSKIIELMDKARIAGKTFGRCHLLQVAPRP